MDLSPHAETLRIDKWLWYARFFKSRGLATKLVASGKLRLNGEVISKPHRQIQIGQTLTFPQAQQIRVIRIDALANRRGPASEAALLYTDLAPPEQNATKKTSARPVEFEVRNPGAGRPTKKDRRTTQKLKDSLG
jgi:ribosome-associated heat shock protein Hsp15